jgi:hypothetical protein
VISRIWGIEVSATVFQGVRGVRVSVQPCAFVLENDSKSILHELWVYPQQQPRLQELLAAKRSGQDVSEEDYLQGIAGKVEVLPAGKSGGFDARLSPGTYEIACFEVATMNEQQMVHCDMGVHTTIMVH